MKIYGDVALIREFEDCIRATKRYVKIHRKDDNVQSTDIPSSLFTETYIVYLAKDEKDILRTEHDIFEAWVNMYNWFVSDSVKVQFTYDYREDKQFAYDYRNGYRSILKFSTEKMEDLVKVIPGFGDLLKKSKSEADFAPIL